MAGLLRRSKDSPLIQYAIRKLDPEIFSHPVWVRYWASNRTITLEAIQNLYTQAEELQRDSPKDACQLLLICAACESSTACLDSALRVVQQALSLAERNHLPQETIWATWGACAICYQAANYEHAIRYLEYLESELNDQNDWMLADFVQTIAQNLLNSEAADKNKSKFLDSEQPESDLVSLTLNWLQDWGLSVLSPGSMFDTGTNQVGYHGFSQHRLSDVFSVKLAKQKVRNSFLNAVRSLLSVRTTGSLDQGEASRIPRVAILPSTAATPNTTYLPNKSISTTTENKHILRTTPISITVQMLGPFRMTIQESLIKVPASRGLSLLKYLVLHHKQDTPREVLMDIFWPNSDIEAARNNLNVAMHNLRQVLRSATEATVIRFEDGAYGLSSNLDIWLDVEEFERCIREAQQLEARDRIIEAVTNYEIAVNLYQGNFLADSPYEDWAVSDRERIQIAYLEALNHISQIYFSQERYTACITQCQLVLNYDQCREDVHCRLMQCYSRLGQAPLAMRQYQICVEALRDELDVEPAPETTQLYEQIRQRETV